MRNLLSPRIIDLVAAQQVDIGLSVLPFETPDVEAKRLLRFEMVCILPAGHPLADKTVIDLQDLDNYFFISRARDHCSLMTNDCTFPIKDVQRKPHHPRPPAVLWPVGGVSIIPSFVGSDFAPDTLIRRRIFPENTTDLWLQVNSLTFFGGSSHCLISVNKSDNKSYFRLFKHLYAPFT